MRDQFNMLAGVAEFKISIIILTLSPSKQSFVYTKQADVQLVVTINNYYNIYWRIN